MSVLLPSSYVPTYMVTLLHYLVVTFFKCHAVPVKMRSSGIRLMLELSS